MSDKLREFWIYNYGDESEELAFMSQKPEDHDLFIHVREVTDEPSHRAQKFTEAESLQARCVQLEAQLRELLNRVDWNMGAPDIRAMVERTKELLGERD